MHYYCCEKIDSRTKPSAVIAVLGASLFVAVWFPDFSGPVARVCTR